MIYYNCDCGCQIPRVEMIPNKTGILTCPEHLNSKTISRYIFCIECGLKRELIGLKSGNETIRCVKHQNIRNKQKIKEKNKNYWQKNANKGKEAKCRENNNKVNLKRRSNCVHAMTTCWRENEFKDNLPCEGCSKFKQQDFSADVYNTRLDYSVRSRHSKVMFV